jgi:NitT/TauT family transport system permease protein
MGDLLRASQPSHPARDGVHQLLGDAPEDTDRFRRCAIVGVPIGILMGRYRYAKYFFFDMVYLAANVPLIIYAIVGLLLFGLGDAGPALVVALLVLPVIALNVAAGVEGVDRGLLTMSQAYHRPTRSALRHVVAPSFAPYLFAASRASFAAS